MAQMVLLPRLGNSVESSIIVRWLKQPGELVAEGEPLCEVETDKTTVEVPSPADGTVLMHYFQVGDDVPVQTAIAAIGAPGEEHGQEPGVRSRESGASSQESGASSQESGARSQEPGVRSQELGVRSHQSPATSHQLPATSHQPPATSHQPPATSHQPPATNHEPPGISPRARRLAGQSGIDPSAISGSGPGGRVIERDIQAAAATRPRLTPVARAMVERGAYVVPAQGSGIDRRISARDLQPLVPPAPPAAAPAPSTDEQEVHIVPLAGVRRVIAERMLASTQTTAQLTLNASADARQLLDYRTRLKASDESLGLRGVTINDLLLFAVARTLIEHPTLNATFEQGAIRQYRRIQLAFAVDTPRGLLVPVVRDTGALSLRALARETARLAESCQSGRATPDELSGGSFTVSNLGSMGIESFTPILNPPQVAILGVGAIQLRPVEQDGAIGFVPHLGLSLTINHQVIDGAPAARFLQALARNLGSIDLILAL